MSKRFGRDEASLRTRLVSRIPARSEILTVLAKVLSVVMSTRLKAISAAIRLFPNLRDNRCEYFLPIACSLFMFRMTYIYIQRSVMPSTKYTSYLSESLQSEGV